MFNGRLVEAQSANLKKWRKAIADACQPFYRENIHLGPVRLEVDFFLERPKTVTQAKRPLPIVPPDLDKLIRAVGDGIGQGADTGKTGDGMIWGDDSQVVELVARKFYADEREQGADIRIIFL